MSVGIRDGGFSDGLDERALPLYLRDPGNVEQPNLALLTVPQVEALFAAPDEVASAQLCQGLGLSGTYELLHRGQHFADAQSTAKFTGTYHAAHDRPGTMVVDLYPRSKADQLVAIGRDVGDLLVKPFAGFNFSRSGSFIVAKAAIFR